MKVRFKTIFEMVLIVTGLLIGPALSSYIIGKSFRNIFMCAILCMIFGLIILFLWFSNFGLSEYQKEHSRGFRLTLLYGIISSCIFPFFPIDGWFVLPLALALVLTSNFSLAILVFTGLLAICVFIGDGSIVVFLIYLFSGLLVELLFSKIDDNIKVKLPLFISLLVYSIGLIGKSVFYSQNGLNLENFILPLINIFLCLVIMFGVLRVFCAKGVDKEKGQFIDINDQEFPLLAKYKEQDPDLYYNAIHTAYFCEKIARLRGMDINLAKNGGYYHKIVANECNVTGKTLEEICESYKFPPKAISLLQEYNYKSYSIKQRETAIVYLSDAVITSILFLQGKDDQKEIDYGQLAKGLISRKIDSGIFNESDLSLKDIQEVEKVFIGEKLYYDFLRRK